MTSSSIFLALLFVSVVTLQLLAGPVRAQLPLLSSGDINSCAECPDEEGTVVKIRPVCGTDGRTYEGRCQLDRAKCQGHPVEVAHKGKCPETGRCRAQRALAQMQARKYAVLGIFVPECKEDGNYFEVQCHGSTGYCWCIDEAGKPIPGSSVRYQRPNCLQQGCSNTERSTFNQNLIDIFKSEWSRIPAHTAGVSVPSTDPLLDTEKKRVIQWKFTQLDVNTDQALRRREVRDLRRLVKKIVRPRPCARTFVKYCDLDQDKVISRSEWSVCLGVDVNNEQLDSPDSDTGDPAQATHQADTGADEEEEEEELETEDPRASTSWGSRPLASHLNMDVSDAGIESREEESLQDCGSARRSAQEHQRQAPSGGHYIPECSENGSSYMEAQCHQQTCWCVTPKNGKPIRGTATRTVKPDCQAARKTTFKGCSLKKKQRFVEEYVAFMKQEMADDTKNQSQSITSAQTPEQIARWKHSQLDINRNQVLDRKEWKLFRRDWKVFRKVNKRRKKLRKCWRHFPRFCDKNSDSRVTIQEWLVCTGTGAGSGLHVAAIPGETASHTKGTVTSDKGDLPRRKGQNPFDKILKSE